jgi:hypothetical protein
MLTCGSSLTSIYGSCHQEGPNQPVYDSSFADAVEESQSSGCTLNLMGSPDDHERFGMDTTNPLEFKDDPSGSWTSPTYALVPTKQDDLCTTDYKETNANAGRLDVWDTRSQ